MQCPHLNIHHDNVKRSITHGGERDKFLIFATIFIVFLLKNVANEIKAFRSLVKISDYKLIQNIFALIISKQISL